MGHPRVRAAAVRRFAGPHATECVVLCRPTHRVDAAGQAEEAYRELAAILAEHQASFRDLGSETLFFRDIRRELPAVLDVRQRVLTELGEAADAPAPAFIEQAPLATDSVFELAAWATVPHDRSGWSVRDLSATPGCPCAGCARTGGRLVGVGGQTSLVTTNIYGGGSDTYTQVWNAFREAARLLEQSRFGFGDVVRTWIHLRDIDRDYDALNRARREFFRQAGIEVRPASTGVQGGPFPDEHDVSLRLHAVRAPGAVAVTPLSTPSLNEAWSYGADFSRGLKVVEANRVTLHVSGTASIDAQGRTAHPGDLPAQIDRMLHNIGGLLAQEGATFAHVVSGVAYLKDPGDAPMLRTMAHDRGFDGFPCALVEAPLCRPELLCESEVVALLPREEVAR